MPSTNHALNRFGGREVFATANVSGAATIDLKNGNLHRLTLTGNLTSLGVTNALSGSVCSVTIELLQDATGGRTIALGTAFKWPGGTAPTFSTAANRRDIVSAYSTDGGATWFAFASINMA